MNRGIYFSEKHNETCISESPVPGRWLMLNNTVAMSADLAICK